MAVKQTVPVILVLFSENVRNADKQTAVGVFAL